MTTSRLVGAMIGAGAAVASLALPTAAQAATPPVPTDCSTYANAYRADGHRIYYGYVAGKPVATGLKGDALGWQPTALVNWGGAGGDNLFISDDFAVHPNGNLYNIHREGTDTAVTKQQVKTIAGGWGGTRALAVGEDLYRLTANGLYRYPLTSSGRYLVPGRPTTIGASGWSGVTTLVYERTEGRGAATVDVLLGTQTNGALKEWRIKRAAPVTVSTVTLKATGWNTFTSVNTGYCDRHPNGRPILGITGMGAAYAYYDKTANDGKGTDFTGVRVRVGGWTAKAYSQ